MCVPPYLHSSSSLPSFHTADSRFVRRARARVIYRPMPSIYPAAVVFHLLTIHTARRDSLSKTLKYCATHACTPSPRRFRLANHRNFAGRAATQEFYYGEQTLPGKECALTCETTTLRRLEWIKKSGGTINVYSARSVSLSRDDGGVFYITWRNHEEALTRSRSCAAIIMTSSRGEPEEGNFIGSAHGLLKSWRVLSLSTFIVLLIIYRRSRIKNGQLRSRQVSSITLNCVNSNFRAFFETTNHSFIMPHLTGHHYFIRVKIIPP